MENFEIKCFQQAQSMRSGLIRTVLSTRVANYISEMGYITPEYLKNILTAELSFNIEVCRQEPDFSSAPSGACVYSHPCGPFLIKYELPLGCEAEMQVTISGKPY